MKAPLRQMWHDQWPEQLDSLCEFIANVKLKLCPPMKHQLEGHCGCCCPKYTFCFVFSYSRIPTECFMSPAPFNSAF